MLLVVVWSIKNTFFYQVKLNFLKVMLHFLLYNDFTILNYCYAYSWIHKLIQFL